MIRQSRQMVPLFESSVSAGFPSPAEDHLERSLDIHELLVSNPAATFFIRTSGDSMTGAGILSGDLLVVDRSLKPSHGRVVLAAINGDFTVKRLVREKGWFWLMAENPAYSPMALTEDVDHIIWGVVTHSIHTLL